MSEKREPSPMPDDNDDAASFPSADGAIPEAQRSESILLVRKAQAGDESALNALFTRYLPRLHRIASIRMGAQLRNVMDSMDIVQRTNAVALRKLGSFEVLEHAGVLHWLSKILENQLRDARKEIRRDKRDVGRDVPMERLRGDDPEAPGFEPVASGPSPSQDASANELERIYDECVQEMDVEHREVLLLRDYEGGSWSYVAEQMGRPNVHATQELHRRARIKLARKLGRRVGLDGDGSARP